jgi:hypothetical protein
MKIFFGPKRAGLYLAEKEMVKTNRGLQDIQCSESVQRI